jgi:glyoxylase-like metal-dependent hydrolase (beta-lactamase superfamily II)
MQPIRHLRGVRISNVFLLDGGPGDRWLIDTGHWAERAALALELRDAGVWPSELTGVLLTHRHSDHAGNARWLREKFGVPIYAHRADAEILDGTEPLPVMERGEGSLVAAVLAQFENHFPARVPVERALDDGDTIGSLEVHWVPGHTEGSVFYRHGETRSLLSGDTLLTALPPLVYRAGLALPYPTFTRDMEQARASIRAFHERAIDYEHLLPGHGKPLINNARRTFLEFLEQRGIIPAMSRV